MDRDITIVTAFFDIGREKYATLPRSNEKYISWFKSWSRMNNRLVIYCENEIIASRVKDIRTKYGLADKTNVVILPDLLSIDVELYKKMESVSKDPYFHNIRLIKNATSNIAAYDLINYLKSYFMLDAYKRFELNGQIAWIDFGFNHGGDLYPYSEDFELEWKYDFGRKITLFYLAPMDQRPAFEIARTLKPDCVMGCLFVVDTSLIEKFWITFRSCAMSLLTVGLLDDDQLILLMAGRELTNDTQFIESDWFLPLKQFGCETMRTVPNKGSKNGLKKFKYEIEKRKKILTYLVNDYKTLVKTKGI